MTSGRYPRTVAHLLNQSAAQRRHALDETFFRDVDSQAKAYWLGLIFADGCIHGTSLSLSLARRDKAILVAFRQAIHSEAPVVDYDYCHGAFSRLLITSFSLVADLNRLGATENKTQRITFPALDEELVRHFMRGYFDGDGSLYKSIAKDSRYRLGFHHNWTFSLTGYKRFIEQFQNHLMQKCHLHKTRLAARHSESPNVVTLRYCGFRQIACIDAFLCCDAEVLLDRKHVNGAKNIVKRFCEQRLWNGAAGSRLLTLPEPNLSANDEKRS